MARGAYNPFPYPGSEESSGLGLPYICASVWSLWYKAQDGKAMLTGEPLPFWPETDDEYRYGWQRGVIAVMPEIEAADGTPVTTLAHRLYVSVHSALHDGSAYRAWEEIGPEERLLWRLLVQHLLRLMLYDASDGSYEDWEEEGKRWFQDKLKEK